MTTAERYEPRIGPGGQTTPLATDILTAFWNAAHVAGAFRVSAGTTAVTADTTLPAERTALLQHLVERTLDDDGLDWAALEQARESWG